MGLIEREQAINAERRAKSQELFGHTGAAIPGLFIDWRAEALSLESRVRNLHAENIELRARLRNMTQTMTRGSREF